jgi:aryl-alcohol dehydrogenase-like predicted oxidoreductase
MMQRPGPYERYRVDAVFDALERLETWAALRNARMSAVAMAWLLSLPEVTAIVVGPNRVEHLAHVAEALELRLTSAEQDELGSWFA